jgi:predicted hotdog family 3-hydroxylacyl-ACP dehydratase
MIIGCRHFDLHVPFLEVGDEAIVRVRRIRGNESLSHFDCEIARGEERVASATLTLYHAEKPPNE